MEISSLSKGIPKNDRVTGFFEEAGTENDNLCGRMRQMNGYILQRCRVFITILYCSLCLARVVRSGTAGL